MKRLFIILFILSFTLLVQGQTIWYVSGTGSDSGSGSSSSPWRTAAYALSQVPSVRGSYGDIIHFTDGTYYLTSAVFQNGVSVTGTDGAHFISTYSSDAWVWQVTNPYSGTIYIRNIWLDGSNTTGLNGILVHNADRVVIEDNTFEDMLRHACRFDGSTFRTGNKFLNNSVVNCAGGVTSFGDESYALEINRQTNFELTGGYYNEKERPISTAGIPIGGLSGTKGMVIDGIELHAHYRQGAYWTFGIELWVNEGITIKNSRIDGEIDLGGFGVFPGAYANGLVFEDNIIGPDAAIGRSAVGLQIEQYVNKAIIRRNRFQYLDQALYFCLAWPSDKVNYLDDVEISSNEFYRINNYSGGYAMRFESGSNDDLGGSPCLPPTYVTNLKIINNTALADPSLRANYFILLPSQGRTSGVTNIQVRNNIASGFASYAIYAYQQDSQYSQSINGLSITNQIYYNNYSNSAYFSGFTPSNYTNVDNLVTDPLFISTSDQHLQSNSPAVRTGIYYSSILDKDKVAFLNPPSRGCYEYTTGITIPTVSTLMVTDIDEVSAVSGGYISSDGGSVVSSRGVCWSTSVNPTTANSRTIDGSGTGTYTSAITGLSSGVTYHVRAYAINSAGTAYGVDRQFSATSEQEITILKLDDGRLLIIDGKALRP